MPTPTPPPPHPTPTDLRATIAAAREAQGVSINELAAAAGCTREALSRYLNGRADMGVSKVEAVLARLGLEVRPTAAP